jgi:hypothetical protein
MLNGRPIFLVKKGREAIRARGSTGIRSHDSIIDLFLSERLL